LNGKIVILNGVPRSGKSSIAAAIQASFDGIWMNLGVDATMATTPKRYLPGIGLRPGGERPDLEPFIAQSYAALFETIAAHSRLGLNIVSDLGIHDSYSRPLGVLADAARRLAGLPALFVGVRCPIEVIMARRNADPRGYVAGEGVPEPVRRWQEAVHRPGTYDLEVDTSVMSPEQCVDLIFEALIKPRSSTALDRIGSAR
jgi:chloramphenicol 3-O phosphotransferase